MILSFSGDPFLAPRAARRALRELGVSREEVTELGEGLDAAQVSLLAAQSGLFGRVALLLDFDAAFKGQAGVKPRNDLIKALAAVPEDTIIVITDLGATDARRKALAKLGDHQHLPTPRFGALTQWIRTELEEANVRFRPDVPAALADLFGEDLPGIASEIEKLAVLDEQFTAERVREITGRLAARDAFDLIEATAGGDARAALATCRALLAQGEAPPRVLGALNWQFDLVARCVALRETRGRADANTVASALRVRPFVAQKALGIARKLDEARLRRALSLILAAEVRMKSGKDDAWALEGATLELAQLFAA